MGILSRIFGKEEKDKTFQAIENEMAKLKKKTDAEMIAIIGTGGRYKGLPLIYVSNNEDELKITAARLIETINPLKNIASTKRLRDFIINYEDSKLFFKPLMENIAFFSVYYEKSEILPLKQWIYKKEGELKDLFHD